MKSPYPKAAWLFLAVVLVGGIGTLEYFSSPEITFSIFYLAPVCLATWFVSQRAGLFFASLAAVDWFVHEYLWGATYSSLWIPFWNAAVRSSFLAVVAILLGRLQAAMNQDHSLARHDSLTGLLNRRGFYERVDIELKRARRTHQPLTIAYMDLDNFKQVNDRWGHEAGDKALKSIADVFTRQLREMDAAGRLGGDEFALLLPETSAEATRLVLTHLQEKLLQLMQARELPITFSIGLVTYLKLPQDIPEMIRKADALMYSIKRQGKNGVVQEVLSA